MRVTPIIVGTINLMLTAFVPTLATALHVSTMMDVRVAYESSPGASGDPSPTYVELWRQTSAGFASLQFLMYIFGVQAVFLILLGVWPKRRGVQPRIPAMASERAESTGSHSDAAEINAPSKTQPNPPW
jgi:hypothetical protein